MPVWRRSPLSQEQILAALTYTCVRARAECQGCAPFAIFLLGPFWGEQWPRPSHSGVSTHWPEKLKAVVRPSVRVRPAVALAIRSFSISGLTASTRPPRRRPPPPPPLLPSSLPHSAHPRPLLHPSPPSAHLTKVFRLRCSDYPHGMPLRSFPPPPCSSSCYSTSSFS